MTIWSKCLIKANSPITCCAQVAPLPFPCHAVSLMVYIVSLPLDLHSAAVFDSHLLCHAHAAALPCSNHAVLKAISQGHGTARQRRSMGTAGQIHGSADPSSLKGPRYLLIRWVDGPKFFGC
jgi:hypothetical protein